MSPYDHAWAARAKRRWGRLINWSLAKGQPLTDERSMVLSFACWCMAVDRRLYRLGRRLR